MFFQPVDIHRLATDLLLAFRLMTALAAVLKQFGDLRQQLLIPGRHLAAMHRKLARQLGRRVIPAERR